MWRYWDGFWGGGWQIGMFLMMAVWWALIIAAAVVFMRWLLGRDRARRNGGGVRPPAAEDDPLTIAKRRYARGEITREQYEELKETLLR